MSLNPQLLLDQGARCDRGAINDYHKRHQQYNEITTAPMRFNTIPSRAISLTVSRCEPKTIALGGVATGNINAKLALSVAGTIRISGSI